MVKGVRWVLQRRRMPKLRTQFGCQCSGDGWFDGGRSRCADEGDAAAGPVVGDRAGAPAVAPRRSAGCRMADAAQGARWPVVTVARCGGVPVGRTAMAGSHDGVLVVGVVTVCHGWWTVVTVRCMCSGGRAGCGGNGYGRGMLGVAAMCHRHDPHGHSVAQQAAKDQREGEQNGEPAAHG